MHREDLFKISGPKNNQISQKTDRNFPKKKPQKIGKKLSVSEVLSTQYSQGGVKKTSLSYPRCGKEAWPKGSSKPRPHSGSRWCHPAQEPANKHKIYVDNRRGTHVLGSLLANAICVNFYSGKGNLRASFQGW